MFSKGVRVNVQGFANKTGELVVWEIREKGLMLCTEAGYQCLIEGGEAPIVGFPMCDIIGLVEEPQPPQ